MGQRLWQSATIEFTSCLYAHKYVRAYHQTNRNIPAQQHTGRAIHEERHDRWIGRGKGVTGLPCSWLWLSLGTVSRVASVLKACTRARSVSCWLVALICSGTLRCFAFIRVLRIYTPRRLAFATQMMHEGYSRDFFLLGVLELNGCAKLECLTWLGIAWLCMRTTMIL